MYAQMDYHRIRISIHAPTRGATHTGGFQYSNSTDFNPRSHTGSDVDAFYKVAVKDEFQSTLPHGERPLSRSIMRLVTYFNPRSHTGSDFMAGYLAGDVDISIHAPTRGATYTSIRLYKQLRFQSTLPHGERHYKRYSTIYF